MSEINHQSINCLNALLASYELVESLDIVKETNYYKQSLKKKVNALMPELEKYSEELKTVWGVDDDTLYRLMNDKKKLIKKIATIRPEQKSGLNELLEMFFKTPELVLHRNGIMV